MSIANTRALRMFVCTCVSMLFLVTEARSEIPQIKMDNAIAIAGAFGYSLPPGTGWKIVQKDIDGAGLCIHADETIIINPSAWDSKYKITHTAENLSGIIALILMHEITHISHDPSMPHDERRCTEAALQATISGIACEIAGEVVPGSPAHHNMCEFIKTHALGDPTDPHDGFNEAAAREWATFNCGPQFGPFPEITPCPHCAPW